MSQEHGTLPLMGAGPTIFLGATPARNGGARYLRAVVAFRRFATTPGLPTIRELMNETAFLCPDPGGLDVDRRRPPELNRCVDR